MRKKFSNICRSTASISPGPASCLSSPSMDREYFMQLADRFRSPHLWKWEDNMWKLRYTPYEGDSEVLWGDPRGTHHESIS